MIDGTATGFDLSEIFVSIQGEGRHLGQPSLFIRGNGCNLRCHWGDTPCDTGYAAWDFEPNILSIDAILRKAQELLDQNPAIFHAVVTGGEPMCQPGVIKLLNQLSDRGMFITLETNGTIAPIEPTPVGLVSLSPKLASSVPHGTPLTEIHDSVRINMDVLRYWTTHYECQLKFVVYGEEDEQEIKALLAQMSNVLPEQVFLMPEGVDINQLQEHAQYCVDLAIRNGWRYTPRAQIEIFGNQRGK